MRDLDESAFSTLRRRLGQVYADEGVARVLGATSMCEWFATREQRVQGVADCAMSSATGVLTKLWVLGETVPLRAVREALGSPADVLTAAGWLEGVGDDHQRSPLSILPCNDLWVVTDHLHSQDKPESVFFPDSSSVNLFCCLPESKGHHLDIGTGCGMTAIAAARNGQEVDVNDLNPRALTLTRMAFALNGCPRPNIREGDFTSIEGQFDSIAFNLPLPSGAGGVTDDEPIHSRSNRGDILREVLEWLPGRLLPRAVSVLHARFPDDISGFGLYLEKLCAGSRLQGLAVYAPDKGTGNYGVLVLRRTGLVGFKCLKIDPNDTAWREHWGWQAVSDLLDARQVSIPPAPLSRLRIASWIRPLARVKLLLEGGWRIEAMQLFGVELSYTEAQAFLLLGEGHTLEKAANSLASTFSITRDVAEKTVGQLAVRLLSAGLAALDRSGSTEP
jgi:hypothetical protein